MEKIINHSDLALDDIVPYLRSFDTVKDISDVDSDRYQEIENCLWYLLQNMSVNLAREYWLDIIGAIVGADRVYFEEPTGAFTFGSSTSLALGFGAGILFNKTDYITGNPISRDDLSFRRIIKAKIVENSSDATMAEFKTAIKLVFNATSVTVVEQYPAGVKVTLEGDALDISYGNNYDLVKSFLPAGVSINEIIIGTDSSEMFVVGGTVDEGLGSGELARRLLS